MSNSRDNEAFWTVPPIGIYDPDWVYQFRGGTPASSPSPSQPLTAMLLRPSHVEARWAFVAAQDVMLYTAARNAAEMSRRHYRPTEPTRQLSTTVPQMRITEFIVGANAFHITAEWNDLTDFPDGILDVLFSERLENPDWFPVHWVSGIPSGVAGATHMEVMFQDLYAFFFDVDGDSVDEVFLACTIDMDRTGNAWRTWYHQDGTWAEAWFIDPFKYPHGYAHDVYYRDDVKQQPRLFIEHSYVGSPSAITLTEDKLVKVEPFDKEEFCRLKEKGILKPVEVHWYDKDNKIIRTVKGGEEPSEHEPDDDEDSDRDTSDK